MECLGFCARACWSTSAARRQKEWAGHDSTSGRHHSAGQKQACTAGRADVQTAHIHRESHTRAAMEARSEGAPKAIALPRFYRPGNREQGGATRSPGGSRNSDARCRQVCPAHMYSTTPPLGPFPWLREVVQSGGISLFQFSFDLSDRPHEPRSHCAQ